MGRNGFNRFNLIWTVSNGQIRVILFQRFNAILPLINKVLKAVLTVEAVDSAVGIIMLVVPDKGFVSVTVENNRTVLTHSFKCVGIQACLLSTRLEAGIT